MPSPLISIITICHNNLAGLKATLSSTPVAGSGQLEHIIIDGNSKDGTKDFLAKLDREKYQWLSEPDKGIYDAMNKGIKIAQGNWIIFMNAGDQFSDSFTIPDSLKSDQYEVVYGNAIIHYKNEYSRLSKPKSLDKIWKGMSFSHQSVFVRTKLLKEHPFDLSYQFCADFEQLYSFYAENRSFHYIDKVIAEIEAGGVSDKKRYVSTREVYRINRKLNPSFKIHPFFILKIIWGFITVKIRSILPQKLSMFLVRLKYKKDQ